MSPKIVCWREATEPRADHNEAVRVPNLDRLSGKAPGVLAGRTVQVALLAALTVMTLIEARLLRNPQGQERGTGMAIVLAPFAVVPLALSRRWPALAAVLATAISVALISVQDTALTIAPFGVTLYAVGQLVRRRGLTIALPLLVPFIINTGAPLDGSSAGLTSALPLLFLLTALVVGESLRKHGLAVAALDATEQAMAESNRARGVMEERARIARELHDIVAHHLSVITIESETAQLTSPELSADAASRFETIASTAREALTETRRLLGVLRDDSTGEPERTPQPGLDDLDDLIARAQATGTPIHFVREGEIPRLPPGVAVAVYRILQEALTNARRHAPGADVDVAVSYREHALHLHVRDHGREAANSAAMEGHGLMGMRERATLVGGTLTVGPADGGGFAVLATLPTLERTP